MVESSESSEESSEWEVIQHSSSHEPSSPPPPQAQLLDFELVIKDNFFDDGSSVFPPSEHEDLPLLQEDCNSPRLSRSQLSSSSSDDGLPPEQQIKLHSRLSIMINGIGTTMHTLTRKMFQDVLCRSSKRCSSIITGAAIVVVLFASMKILQWRIRILLLLQEKDQNQPALAADSSHERDLVSTAEGSSLENQLGKQQHEHSIDLQLQLV